MPLLSADAWRRPWYGMLAPTGRPTDDQRALEPGAVECRQLPLPLRLQTQSAPGHFGSVIVGSITGWAETPETGIFSVGTWLDPAVVPEVCRAVHLVESRLARPSLDLLTEGIIAEVRPGMAAGDPVVCTHYQRAVADGATILAGSPAYDGTFLRTFDGDLTPEALVDGLRRELTASGFTGQLVRLESAFALSGTTSWRTMPVAAREYEFNRDEAVRRILAWANGSDSKARSMFLWIRPESAVGTMDRYVFPIGDIINGKPHLVFHAAYSAAAILNGAHGGVKDIPDADRARLRETITSMYQRMSTAFSDPNLEAPWVKRARLPERSRTASVTAPVAPPAAWFQQPEPNHPTNITITDDGRLSGHLAPWDQCHVGLGQLTGECVTPPRSTTNYRMFHSGTVRTAEGNILPVGRITVGTTHPVGWSGTQLDAAATARHYEHTGACAAVVQATDGRHGIWLSGALVPEADDTTAALVRRHPLSGDWRQDRTTGRLELIAALAVNSPGFPVIGVDNDGHRFSLIASAAPECLAPSDTTTTVTGEDTSTTTIATPDTTTTDTTIVDSQPVVDPEQVARRAAQILTDAATRRERLATHATAQWSRRMDRLRQMGNSGVE